MGEKFNLEFLKTISLADLREMKDFYELLSKAEYLGESIEGLNYDLVYEREKLIEIAIKYKQCFIDTQLFGTSVLDDPKTYIEGSIKSRSGMCF